MKEKTAGSGTVPGRRYLIESPVGALTITVDGQQLRGIGWGTLPGASERLQEGVARQVSEALQCYFSDPDSQPCLPLLLRGSAFQHRVWACLRQIPVGKTRTYGEIAERLRTSPRAVGNACRANPCPIVVPCHRVVGRRGFGGFAGDRSGRLLSIKMWLLAHEGVLDRHIDPDIARLGVVSGHERRR